MQDGEFVKAVEVDPAHRWVHHGWRPCRVQQGTALPAVDGSGCFARNS
jgi:hypothetical protein